MRKLGTILLAVALFTSVGGVLLTLQPPVAQAIFSDQSRVTVQTEIDTILSSAGGPGLFIWPDRWKLSSLTVSQQQAIAQRNDFILRDAVDTSVNATLKAANPNIGIVGYVNAMWLWKGDEDFIWSYNWVNTNHPEWFLKDASGRRIQSGTHWGWMMDLGNPGWQQYIADAAIRAIRNGINGIYVDDAHEVYPNFYSASGYPINPRTGAQYTSAEWKQDTYNLLKRARDAVRAAYPNDPSKLLLYNGYINGWQGEYFMPVADGAQSEGFVHAYWESATSFRDAATWKGEIDDLINYQNQGKLIFATSGASGGDLNMYTYSSYLLGKGPRSYYNYANYGNGGMNGWAGFNAPIGVPSGSYYYASNVYQREYSNARVLVNPTTNTYTVNLGAGMYRLNQDGSIAATAVSSVTLGPHSGAILLKSPSGSLVSAPTATPIPPTVTATPVPPTATLVPPTATPVPPTATPVPPTATPVPPTATRVPPTATLIPPTATPVPPTATPVPPAVPAPPAGQRPAAPTPTPVPPTPTATPVPPTPTATPTPAPAPSVNLALGRSGASSSIVGPGYEARRAFDGNGSTYWFSEAGDYQWMYIDLGTTRNITKVVLKWGSAFGKDYRIQVSDNPYVWGDASVIFKRTGWTGGTDTIPNLAGKGRYIRVYGTARGTNQGYMLQEFEVYGN